MKKLTMLAAAALMCIAAAPAFADSAPVAPATITFSTLANMQSLKDSNQKDSFTVGILDAQVNTSLTMQCEAGGSHFLFLHKDKQCSVTGSGGIVNPSNKAQVLQRTQYQGGYIVKADGTTDGSTLVANYLSLGKAPAMQTAFGGSLNLKPELTSSGAAALTTAVLNKLNTNANGALIDQRVDTVDLNGLFIPSAGLPSDKGCTWTGNMVFAYQTQSWFMDMKANCNGKEFPFKGNMPFTNVPGSADQTQYDLTLTLPDAATAASASDDSSLFATTTGADGNADLFATVNGISGHILMKNSENVTVKVDGKDTTTPARVDASGTLTGTGVPLDTVRSLSVLFGLISENLFGA